MTLEKCPDCSTPLEIAPGIGPYCPNSKCDRIDYLLGDAIDDKWTDKELALIRKNKRKNRMKKIAKLFLSVGSLAGLLLCLVYFSLTVGKQLSYNWFYKSMVEKTVKELVKQEALKNNHPQLKEK